MKTMSKQVSWRNMLKHSMWDSPVFSYTSLSSLWENIMEPEESMCYRNHNQRQRETLGFRVSFPWASQTRPEQAAHWAHKPPACIHSSPGHNHGSYALSSVLHTTILIAGDSTDCCGLLHLSKRKPFPESLQVIAATIDLILKSRKKGRRSLFL